MTVLSRQSILRAVQERAAVSYPIARRLLDDLIDRRGNLVIEPFDPKLVQADGVDLRLGPHFETEDGYSFSVSDGGMLILGHGACVLGSTIERVEIPLDMTANTLGRSSVGRKFVVIHCTAGSIDPGFKGHITLEIVNHSHRVVELPIGIAIAKLQLLWMDQAVDQGYDGRYQDQGEAPVASRLLDGQ